MSRGPSSEVKQRARALRLAGATTRSVNEFWQLRYISMVLATGTTEAGGIQIAS